MRQFRMFIEQMNEVRREEWLVDLRIATNPHLKAENQRELFQRLKPPAQPTRRLSPEKREMAKKIEEIARKRYGKHGV